MMGDLRVPLKMRLVPREIIRALSTYLRSHVLIAGRADKRKTDKEYVGLRIREGT